MRPLNCPACGSKADTKQIINYENPEVVIMATSCFICAEVNPGWHRIAYKSVERWNQHVKNYREEIGADHDRSNA